MLASKSDAARAMAAFKAAKAEHAASPPAGPVGSVYAENLVKREMKTGMARARAQWRQPAGASGGAARGPTPADARRAPHPPAAAFAPPSGTVATPCARVRARRSCC